MTRQRLLTAVCLAACCFTTSLTSAQLIESNVRKQKQKEADAGEMILKVYRVADLFTPRPDYPYQSGLPTTDVHGKQSVNTGGVPGGMGGGMGGMGGGGMGMMQVPDPLPRVAQFSGEGGVGGGGMGGFAPGLTVNSGPGVDETLRFTRQDLIQAITTTIMPESWQQMGGKGVCTPLGGMLLIKQTAEAHKLIEKLLSDIRTEGGSSHTVTVDALWLSLTSDDFEKLAGEQSGQGGELSPIDPKLLKDLATNNPGHQGRVSCYNDQTVHLVSGNRRMVVVNATPVVGYGIGYSPQVAYPNVGVLLQVRPTVDPNRQSAVLNVISTVTEWQEPDEPFKITTRFEGASKEGVTSKGSSTEVTLDRVNLNTQHLGTTVRVPVGKPVLVGGLSSVGTNRNAKNQPEEKDRQLYLIIKITVNEAPNQPGGK